MYRCSVPCAAPRSPVHWTRTVANGLRFPLDLAPALTSSTLCSPIYTLSKANARVGPYTFSASCFHFRSLLNTCRPILLNSCPLGQPQPNIDVNTGENKMPFPIIISNVVILVEYVSLTIKKPRYRFKISAPLPHIPHPLILTLLCNVLVV